MVPNSIKRFVLVMERELVAWEVIYIVLNIIYINFRLHNTTFSPSLSLQARECDV